MRPLFFILFSLLICHQLLSIVLAEDLYDILEVSRRATPKEIKKAFRNKARKIHPDHAKDLEQNEAREEFERVNRAYNVLSDEEKRKYYDMYGVVKGEQGAEAEGFNPHSPFRGFYARRPQAPPIESKVPDLSEATWQNIKIYRGSLLHVLQFYHDGCHSCRLLSGIWEASVSQPILKWTTKFFRVNVLGGSMQQHLLEEIGVSYGGGSGAPVLVLVLDGQNWVLPNDKLEQIIGSEKLVGVQVLTDWIRSFSVDVLSKRLMILSNSNDDNDHSVKRFAAASIQADRVGFLFHSITGSIAETAFDASLFPALVTEIPEREGRMGITSSSSSLTQFVVQGCKRHIPGFTNEEDAQGKEQQKKTSNTKNQDANKDGPKIQQLLLVFNTSTLCDFFVLTTTSVNGFKPGKILPFVKASLDRGPVPLLTASTSLKYCGVSAATPKWNSNSFHDEKKFCLIWLRPPAFGKNEDHADETLFARDRNIVPEWVDAILGGTISPFTLVQLHIVEDAKFLSHFDLSEMDLKKKKKGGGARPSSLAEEAFVPLLAYSSSLRTQYLIMHLRQGENIVERAEQRIPASLALLMEGQPQRTRQLSSANPFHSLPQDSFYIASWRRAWWLFLEYYRMVPLNSFLVLVLVYALWNKWQPSAAKASSGKPSPRNRERGEEGNRKSTSNNESRTRGEDGKTPTSASATSPTSATVEATHVRGVLILTKEDMRISPAATIDIGYLILIFIPKSIVNDVNFSIAHIPEEWRKHPKLRFRMVLPKHFRWWGWLDQLLMDVGEAPMDTSSMTSLSLSLENILFVALRMKKRMGVAKPRKKDLSEWLAQLFDGTIAPRMLLPTALCDAQAS